MTEVRRFTHGSRIPGWDEAADLSKDPAQVPDEATTPVPAELRAEIEEYMGRYPDRHSASIPALHAVQRHHGWVSPEAIGHGASRRMRGWSGRHERDGDAAGTPIRDAVVVAAWRCRRRP